MSDVISISGRRRYGLARVCRSGALHAQESTAVAVRPPSRRRCAGVPGRRVLCRTRALVEEIRAVLAASPFHGEG